MPRHDPPRIAHVIYALRTGGLENGLVNIINRMPIGRYEHIIICLTEADDFANRITVNGVRVIELHKRGGHDFRFYWRLWRLFRELRPDIIHSRNLAALETQLLAVTMRGVKRVHGEHGRDVNELDGKNRRYMALRRLMGHFIDSYIVVSKDLEHWLAAAAGIKPGKIAQIYNGVDHKKFSRDSDVPAGDLPLDWESQEYKLIIGTVGRLSPIKDQRSLLQAMGLLRDRKPQLFNQLHLLIVGEGPERQALAQEIANLNLQRQVWLAGERSDVPALLNRLDVFVLPSLSEGISNTVLEAMAAGLPVVATAVGGNTELVEDGFNGRLVPVADPAALAGVLAEILNDSAWRQAAGAHARQRVCQRFDWAFTVQSYAKVYDGLLRLPGHNQIVAE